MQPTVNVNLKSCSCEPGTAKEWTECSAAPVLIPCPVPSSVTFEVRMGACVYLTCHPEAHDKKCPARPIRVSCSISGKTWAESEVEDISPVKTDGRGVYEVGWERGQVEPVTRAVHERWALVKALVLGKDVDDVTCPPNGFDLMTQRDAVFSALADMARAESVILQRFADIDKVHTNRSRRSFQGFAADELAAYVAHLVEQVGVLE